MAADLRPSGSGRDQPCDFRANTCLSRAACNTGLGIAGRFAAEGATVFVNGTTAEGVDQALKELRSRDLERLIALPADISRATEVEAMFRADPHGEAGRLDVLVNNAVVQGVGYSFEDTSLELFESVIRINLIEFVPVAREAARMMIAQGGGAHRQHRLQRIDAGNPQTRGLHRQQRGRRRSDTGNGRRSRAARHPREYRRPRLHPHRPLACGFSAEHTQRRRANVPLGKPAKTSPRQCSSWPPMRRPISPGRDWWSMAVARPSTCRSTLTYSGDCRPAAPQCKGSRDGRTTKKVPLNQAR